jgi:hypothetical protein
MNRRIYGLLTIGRRYIYDSLKFVSMVFINVKGRKTYTSQIHFAIMMCNWLLPLSSILKRKLNHPMLFTSSCVSGFLIYAIFLLYESLLLFFFKAGLQIKNSLNYCCWFCFVLFSAVLGFELRALCLLGRYSTSGATPPTLNSLNFC